MSLIDYSRVNWANGSTGGTPLNATNLNNMDYAISQLAAGTSALTADSSGNLTLDATLTVTGLVKLTSRGIALANNYGVHHYTADGSGYSKFEYLNDSDQFVVGNNSYPTYLRGSSITVAQTMTAESAIFCDQGIALANNYGVHHYNTSGEYLRFEYLNDSDQFVVGNNNYATCLYGSSITASKSITTSSDARQKTDFGALVDAHDRLFDGLAPCTYRYRDDPDKLHMGFTVQDTEAAERSAGLTPEDYALTEWYGDGCGESYGALSYSELIALLVGQVQALKSRVTALEAKED